MVNDFGERFGSENLCSQKGLTFYQTLFCMPKQCPFRYKITKFSSGGVAPNTPTRGLSPLDPPVVRWNPCKSFSIKKRMNNFIFISGPAPNIEITLVVFAP